MPTNQGYVSIKKWPQIFVSGTGSTRAESEEKATFTFTNNGCEVFKDFANLFPIII